MFMTLEEHQDLQKAFSANCSFQHPLIQSILLRYNVFENVDA